MYVLIVLIILYGYMTLILLHYSKILAANKSRNWPCLLTAALCPGHAPPPSQGPEVLLCRQDLHREVDWHIVTQLNIGEDMKLYDPYKKHKLGYTHKRKHRQTQARFGRSMLLAQSQLCLSHIMKYKTLAWPETGPTHSKFKEAVSEMGFHLPCH